MHELSLACRVVELVEDTLRKHGGSSVRAIEMAIGELSGVDHDAFRYSLQMVLARSPFPEARIEINRVRPMALCGDCGTDFVPATLYTPCPGCGSYVSRLVSGREFRLVSVTIEEDK